MRHIAFYGKGGIGKSTIVSNLAILLARQGRKVLLVGCDPKHDSSYKVSDIYPIPTVMEQVVAKRRDLSSDDYLFEGRDGLTCVESGGPDPGMGCAGRGITKMFEIFEAGGIFRRDYDYCLFDVLGDVVCGGFAVPMRYARDTAVVIVVSGEIMSLYAGNNISRAIVRLSRSGVRLGGLVGNLRGLADEESRIRAFAQRIGGDVLEIVPQDPLVNEAERQRRTVIEHAPDSSIAAKYRSLCEAVSGLKVEDLPVPRPMGELGFDEFIRNVPDEE